VLGHFLALDESLDEAMTAQELPDLVQIDLEVLEILLRAEGFDHVPAVRRK
jgi:hypothetical protein